MFGLLSPKYEMKTDTLKFLYYSSHWPVKNIIGWFTSEIGINRKMTRNLLLKCYYSGIVKIASAFISISNLEYQGREDWNQTHPLVRKWICIHTAWFWEMCGHQGAHSEPMLFASCNSSRCFSSVLRYILNKRILRWFSYFFKQLSLYSSWLCNYCIS